MIQSLSNKLINFVYNDLKVGVKNSRIVLKEGMGIKNISGIP
jgi:hypothetical protein